MKRSFVICLFRGRFYNLETPHSVSFQTCIWDTMSSGEDEE